MARDKVTNWVLIGWLKQGSVKITKFNFYPLIKQLESVGTFLEFVLMSLKHPMVHTLYCASVFLPHAVVKWGTWLFLWISLRWK